MYCINPMCQKEIEDRNTPCPHCGSSLRKHNIGMLCVGIFSLVLSAWIFYMAVDVSSMGVFICGIFTLVLGIASINSALTAKQKAIERDKNIDSKNNYKQSIISAITTTYNKTYTNITIPLNPHTIYLENSEPCNCWIDNATFYIITSLENLTNAVNKNPDLYSQFIESPYIFTLFQIPISNIEFWTLSGDFYVENRVSGGGSNLGGAIVGGMIAGTAGAVVGGRESVKSESIKHDERIIELKYTENEQLVTILIDKSAEGLLKNLLPEKEYSYIMFKRQA